MKLILESKPLSELLDYATIYLDIPIAFWAYKNYVTSDRFFSKNIKISENVKGYKASYKTCGILYNRVFKDLKPADLQQVIDTCNKDYSTFVEIAQYKDRNPNKHTRTKFTKEDVAKVWTMKEDKYYQIILMLLYNGTRISEFLDLKKENVHLEKQYFDVIDSYWTPLVEQIGIDRTPHCTRHTCISMLSEAGVQDTTINKTLENEDSITSDTKSA